MREIKFRAWDRALKKMLYQKQLEQFDDMIGFRFEHFEDDRPIYMQYTGFKDKNYVKAYEHDIVRDGNGKVYVIRYSGGTGNQPRGCGGFDKFWFFTKTKDGLWGHVESVSYVGMEVIGNIYENPELLEGEK